jgi:hypothetical protein
MRIFEKCMEHLNGHTRMIDLNIGMDGLFVKSISKVAWAGESKADAPTGRQQQRMRQENERVDSKNK